MYMFVCFYIHDLSAGLRRQDCVRSPEAELRGGCESPDVGAGK